MKGTGKKEAEGRRIVADIFLHKERAERKEAEGFGEATVGARGARRRWHCPHRRRCVQSGPGFGPQRTYGSYYNSRLGGRGSAAQPVLRSEPQKRTQPTKCQPQCSFDPDIRSTYTNVGIKNSHSSAGLSPVTKIEINKWN